MENFLITITCLLAGVVLRRLPQMPREGSTVLNLVVIHISLPALVLLKIPELAFSRAMLVPVVMPWLLLGVFAGLTLLIARLAGWSRPVTGALLLLVPMGNTSFLGIPMVTAFFGETGIPYALLYDQLGTFLALSSYGALLLAIYGGEGRVSLRGVLLKIIRFPPFIALLLGLGMHLGGSGAGLSWPPPLTALLSTLAATLVPLVMMAVGWQLTLRLPRELLAPLLGGLGLKMVVTPLVALAGCLALGLSGEPVRVAIFEAGMPPMITAGVLAMLAGLAPPLAAAMIGYGVVLACVTLPLLHRLLLLLGV